MTALAPFVAEQSSWFAAAAFLLAFLFGGLPGTAEGPARSLAVLAASAIIGLAPLLVAAVRIGNIS